MKTFYRKHIIIFLTNWLICAGGFAAGTWTGTENNNWDNPNNWDDTTVPSASTWVILPDGANNTTIDLGGANRVVRGIEITANTTDYTIQNGIFSPGTNIVKTGNATLHFDNNVTLGLNNNVSFLGAGYGSLVVAGSITGTARSITISITNHTLEFLGINNYGNTYFYQGNLRITGANTNAAGILYILENTPAPRVLIYDTTSMQPFGGGRWYFYPNTNSLIITSTLFSAVMVSNVMSISGGTGARGILEIAVPYFENPIYGGINWSSDRSFDLYCNTNQVVLGGVSNVTQGGSFYKYGSGTLRIKEGHVSNFWSMFYIVDGSLVVEGTNHIAWRATVHPSSTGTVVFAGSYNHRITSDRWVFNADASVLQLITIDTNEYRATNEWFYTESGTVNVGIRVMGPGKITFGVINGRAPVKYTINCERFSVKGLGYLGSGAQHLKYGTGILELAYFSDITNIPGTVNIYEGGYMINGNTITNVPTLYSGTIFGGTGSILQSSAYVNIASNVTFVPGDKDVGVFTVANMRFQTNAIYEWHFKDGAGSTCVVTNNLVMYGGKPAKLRIVDLGSGYSFRNNEYVIFTYGGTDPANPDWSFELIGNRFGNCAPTVTVDTVNKCVILKGISIPPPGTFFIIR